MLILSERYIVGVYKQKKRTIERDDDNEKTLKVCASFFPFFAGCREFSLVPLIDCLKFFTLPEKKIQDL